jgi:hypothetical protein
MAVIKTITTERGVVFPDQYCRVDEARVEKTRMHYTVGIYFNQAATENPPHRAETFSSGFDLYGEQNVWQQAYADLKTRWPDSVDA